MAIDVHFRNITRHIRVLTLMTGLLVATGSGAVPNARPADQAAWTLVWSDEFDGAANTGVDRANWLYDTGTGYGCSTCANWGTGEVEVMSSSTANVYQDGAGHLAIKPIHTGTSVDQGWTSGRIETVRTDFRAPIGGALAVEASIQQPDVAGPAAAGYWPAFWMLGAPFRGTFTNWPSVGEIDVMEDINGRSATSGTLHCGTSPGGPCNEPIGLGSGRVDCAGCQTAFHTYRIELDRSIFPEQIRWYLDGVSFFTVASSQIDAATWASATDHGFFLILDVAIGGSFPAVDGGGPTAATTSGIPMLVDYVRVYTRGCVGDCDGDGTVTVDEIIEGVNIALGRLSSTQCPPFDTDGSGTVTVDEIVNATNNALNGCR